MIDVLDIRTGEILQTVSGVYCDHTKRQVNRWIKSIGYVFDHLEIGRTVETIWVRKEVK